MEAPFLLMILKALLYALSSLLGGLGALQVSVLLESYLLLAIGLVLTTFGIVRLMDRPDPIRG